LHLRGVEEDPHLRPGARSVEGNGVQNIASIFCQRPGPSERVVAESCNEGVEITGALAGDFEPLGEVQRIDGRVVSQMPRQRAESELNFQFLR
jgi:hypothetical protein